MSANRGVWPASDWHADEEALRALVDGRIGPVRAVSLESHLMRCETCRGQVNVLAFTDSLEQVWTVIRDEIEAPKPGLVERLMRRIGLSAESGRLLTAVPAMRGGWLLGVIAALVFAGAAAGLAADTGIGLFLLVAPLAPVAGVAAAFGGDADPSHEIVVTTPYSAGRLLLLRTAAVLASSAPVAVLVGWALPAPGWLAVAWLSPAAAAVAVALSVAPAMGLMYSAVSVATVWSVVTITATRVGDPLILVGPVVQTICLTLAVVCAATIVVKYHALDLPGSPS